jgi:hypothetical protein
MAGTAHDGLSDQTAIPIENTSHGEFSDFLYVFYNEYVVSSYHILPHLMIMVSIGTISIPTLQPQPGGIS